MNSMLMLVRREFWEHRSLYLAPAVVMGLILVMSLWSSFVIGDAPGGNVAAIADVSDLSQIKDLGEKERSELQQAIDLSQDRKQTIFLAGTMSFTGMLLGLMCIVVFFYLLDSLYAERRDRSILFWKSLPVSDAEVVFSKLLVAVVVVPIAALIVGAVLQILVAIVYAVRFNGTVLGQILPEWNTLAWLRAQAVMACMALAGVLWCAPVAAYLLLMSAWARRNVFLWAVLPPIALMVGERVTFHTTHVTKFVLERLFGFVREMDLDTSVFKHQAGDVQMPPASDVFNALTVSSVFKSPELWIGLVCAGVLVAATIRIRRYRDES